MHSSNAFTHRRKQSQNEQHKKRRFSTGQQRNANTTQQFCTRCRQCSGLSRKTPSPLGNEGAISVQPCDPCGALRTSCRAAKPRFLDNTHPTLLVLVVIPSQSRSRSTAGVHRAHNFLRAKLHVTRNVQQRSLGVIFLFSATWRPLKKAQAIVIQQKP